MLDQLLYRDLTLGKVHNVHEFFQAANQTPQTFNSFYVDDRDIGVFTSGDVPIRPPDVDPGLPTEGTGKHEWRGGIDFAQHPQGINPPNGEIVNWNNRVAAGLPRVRRQLGARLDPARRAAHRQHQRREADPRVGHLGDERGGDAGRADHAAVAGALEGARGGPRPARASSSSRSARHSGTSEGGSRLDRDGDGKIDAPGRRDPGRGVGSSSRTAWAEPVLGDLDRPTSRTPTRPFDAPPGGQYSGWHIYMDKDLRSLLGEPVKGTFDAVLRRAAISRRAERRCGRRSPRPATS